MSTSVPWIDSFKLKEMHISADLNPPAIPPLLLKHFEPGWEASWNFDEHPSIRHVYEHNDITKAINVRCGGSLLNLQTKLQTSNSMFAKQLRDVCFVRLQEDDTFTKPGPEGGVEALQMELYPDVHRLSTIMNHIATNNRFLEARKLQNLPLLFTLSLVPPVTVTDLSEQLLIGPNKVNQYAKYRVTGFVTSDKKAYTTENEGRSWSVSSGGTVTNTSKLSVIFVLLQKVYQ